MLENNEPIKGVKLEDVFSLMLQDIPWASLKAYIQANSQLLKVCTVGGHRLNPKSLKRVNKILIKEAEKNEYSQAFCNGLFVPWYPVHEELHKKLEDYFHSDEYKEYREGKELDEDAYVLPDEKFDEFFDINDLEQWRILLCFSPLQFTQEQANRIVKDTGGNAELLRRIRDLEERSADLEKENNRLNSEHERLRAQYEQVSSNAQDSRKSERTLKTENTSLEKKLEVALAENRKLKDEKESVETQRKQLKESVASEVEKSTSRLERDMTRVNDELSSWQTRYEQLRVENRELDQKLTDTKGELKNTEKKLTRARVDIDFLNSFPNLLLSKFDWPKVGAQLKLTPTLKRQFNSLIKTLDYEDDNTLAIEGTMVEFWTRLMDAEKELVENVALSNTREVINGDAEGYWMELTDAFEDVRIGLEARTILLKMLHEIFYQVIEMEELDVPKIPKKMTKIG